MMRRWGIILVGVFTVAVWSAPASGEHSRGMEMYGMGPGHGGFQMMLPLLMKGVGLTEAQQTQVKQIVATHQPQFEKLLIQLHATREQLAEKLFAPGPVKVEDLAPLRQQIGRLRDQLTQEALQVALDIRAVLTPEQLAKAGQIRKRLNELRAEMRTLLGRDQ